MKIRCKVFLYYFFLAYSILNFLGFPTEELDFSPLLDGRIIGGESVDITEFPYQISLQRNGRHRCGGAIISPDYIVTAGHCTHG